MELSIRWQACISVGKKEKSPCWKFLKKKGQLQDMQGNIRALSWTWNGFSFPNCELSCHHLKAKISILAAPRLLQREARAPETYSYLCWSTRYTLKVCLLWKTKEKPQCQSKLVTCHITCSTSSLLNALLFNLFFPFGFFKGDFNAKHYFSRCS